MRPRTKSEKVLLTILIGIIFVGGNFYAYQWFSQRQASLNLTYAELKADKAEAQVDLKESDTWAERKSWIQENEPALGNEGDAKAQVSQYVSKGAHDHHLEILDQSLNDVQHGAAGTQINVAVKVKGSMESLCQWLADLQKPANFYAISSFSLKADQDQKSMVCTIQLARYFKE